MSIQIQKRNRNIKLAATAGAVLFGAGYLILTTFPHLKTSIYNTLTGTKTDKDEDEEADNQPIELREETSREKDIESSIQIVNGEESIVNIEKWSDENLKSWLSEVSTNSCKR